ncbi:MAG: RraA family protein [Nostocoides sp.]
MSNLSDHGPLWEELDPDVAAAISTPVLADSLDACGARRQVLRPGISPMTAADRAAGRAHTASFVPDERDSDDPYGPAIDFIDGLTPGSMAVIATGGDNRTAYWGELFSAAALGHGCAGTVTDGPSRDLPKVEALAYPLFSAGSRPVDYRARMAIVSVGSPVEVGGVTVSPGDLVLADRDGVVAVPQTLEREALARAAERMRAESSVLAELLGGASLRQVWETWRVL